MCVGKVAAEVKMPLARTKSVASVHTNPPRKEKIQYSEDILAVSTHYTKEILYGIDSFKNKFQNSVFYKILTHTTQPAHLITALAVISLAFLILPATHEDAPKSSLLTLVYLGSFSAHFGAQIWMTFISGLALYFSLPRHIFGSVQKVLFPKYFLLNAILSLITLVVFLRHNKDLRVPEIFVQTIGMSICFFTELIIRLYLTPPLLTLITEKNQIEKSAGVGFEVGKVDPGKLKHCPHYLKIHKKFRKVHMSIAIGNIVTMACTMLHLYYLSQKLSITAM
ncbi:unnamed protein product [Brassicogethes aeneus]|uniref:TMEM205-like domain-containing protein n=1 Tax=Brassicogethes aeneus TaxID=1431903 RepID=A0A9P0FM32_BRAAE|nr:unnamed protein product [Brassicogethes aeneus]